MMYKLIAILLLILTPIFSSIVVKLLALDRIKLLLTDIAFPLYLLEIMLISDKFLNQAVLPYLLILLAILAISISLFLIIKHQRFSYKRFLKLFWRVGFLLSFIFYLVLIILIFTI
ncbi:DUF3397 family protein [Streptococcus sp. zg-JUN1979]|uniref:DUF3397 family protein n=1 Tax=Streptococcus sp. zg-JUN1979 TaxID=3391450 RepID=UPI0039A71763